jgi:chorismate mutase/prephenate dehydrogenase
MNIGVIGSSGKMGSFFSLYFLSKGFKVYGYDVKGRNARGVISTRNIEKLINYSDVIVIATPIEKTLEVSNSFPATKESKTVIEITSVKSSILAPMRETFKRKGYRLISIHPLFGPSLSDEKEMKFAVIGNRMDVSFLKKIFTSGAEFILFDDEMEHDRMMAYVLSLTHAMGILYSRTALRNDRFKRFEQVSTPMSFLQMILSFSVLSQDEDLISQIQLQNPFSNEVLLELKNEVEKFLFLLESKDKEGLKKFVISSRRHNKQEIYKRSRDLVYKCYEAGQFSITR